MGEFKEKSSNEILMEVEEMKQEHESTKQKLLKLYDHLESIEKRYTEAHKELVKRLNGRK